MTNLVQAYQMRDVLAAEKILKGQFRRAFPMRRMMQLTSPANRATITGDPFIAFFITDLLRSLRTQYIIDIIKSYTRLSLDFLAKTLNIGRDEAEGLVVGLILDEKIKGRIDQVQGVVVLDRL
jgi:COP9 signalosome complex subunit 2